MAAGTKVQLRLGDRVVAEVPFRGAELRVGRMKENDLVINNLAVSRFHAVLRRVGEAFEIEDLGSENGSFVDGIAVRGSAVVPAGASITIGKHTLQIRSGAEAVAKPAPQSKSDAWDAAQTYFAPELAPRAADAEEEEVLPLAAELERGDEAAAEVIEASEVAPLLRVPQSLDLPDADDLFAFGEDELVGRAAPDPVAAAAGVVAEPLMLSLEDELPAVPPSPTVAAEPKAASGPGSQTALFDFGLADDLGLSDRALSRAAEARGEPPAKAEPAPTPTPPTPARDRLYAGLIVERAGRVERVAPWSAAALVVGRAPECDVVLATAGVSRRHARFVREDGRFRVEDLGSANGIRVNGERVEARDLQVGDAVAFDIYTLTFVMDRQPVEGAVRATAAPTGDVQHTVFDAPPPPEMRERDLVLEAGDEAAVADWEKELARAAESAAGARGAEADAGWAFEVRIATERLPEALRAALRELGQDELLLPAELRLTRR